MGMYFLACGTSRSLFKVLNHAGITLSYMQAISKLKRLSEERLTETTSSSAPFPTLPKRIPRKNLLTAFILIWDNLDIAFKVSEQQHDSKDHFDNGMTAILVPLYGIECGKLPLKPKRTNHQRVLKFGPQDFHPSQEEAQCVQAGQLWQIKDILCDVFPSLHKLLTNSSP